MAKLSDFLGELVSSISYSRANADLQTLEIAKGYAKDDMLQHFSVPRMRIENVEFAIPVAIGSYIPEKEILYETINEKDIIAVTYRLLIKILGLDKIPTTISKSIKEVISESFANLIKEINAANDKMALSSFCARTAQKITELTNVIYKQLNKEPLKDDKLAELNKRVAVEMNSALKNYIKLKPALPIGIDIDIIVEADKLREIKIENIITIKMKISEQGMEWVKMENSKGEPISKLMPE